MPENRLGKGLGALITENGDGEGGEEEVSAIFLDNIESNPFQPRKEFEESTLRELADSITENGLIQPITLRRVKPDKYQIVSGERRCRAARIAGLKKIPAIVRDYSDSQMMEVALIENLQREDLNPIEEAQAYKKMMAEFDLTQAQVAERVGKSRSSIANTVRLLNLAPRVQVYVTRETLSMGHARALLSLADSDRQLEAASYIIDNELSVRETEKYITDLKAGSDRDISEADKKQEGKPPLPRQWKEAGEWLEEIFQTAVKIKNARNKKVISIECSGIEDLKRIISKINEGSNVSRETRALKNTSEE
ncbi:MAG: ParB/RepB/Spo0J family partition protein [Halanaerobiaceae bacterium]